MPFRVGLRIADVPGAIGFYRGLGFSEYYEVPDPDGTPVFAMLQRDGALLCVDALVGMPFPDTERERMTQHGPRGLGVALGMDVDDLDAAYEYCTSAGCEITAEPADQPWGARVFECIDPFGYVWEIAQPIAQPSPAEARAAVRASWFGGTDGE